MKKKRIWSIDTSSLELLVDAYKTIPVYPVDTFWLEDTSNGTTYFWQRETDVVRLNSTSQCLNLLPVRTLVELERIWNAELISITASIFQEEFSKFWFETNLWKLTSLTKK